MLVFISCRCGSKPGSTEWLIDFSYVNYPSGGFKLMATLLEYGLHDLTIL